MPKPPKPPKLSAPKEEHKRFAKEVLEYEPYKHEPAGGMHPSDVVPADDQQHPHHDTGGPA